MNKQRAQTLAEYALILALIALVVIAAVTVFGNNILGIFSTLARRI